MRAIAMGKCLLGSRVSILECVPWDLTPRIFVLQFRQSNEMVFKDSSALAFMSYVTNVSKIIGG